MKWGALEFGLQTETRTFSLEAEGRDTSVTSSCPELIYGRDVRTQRPRSVLLVVKCERKERSRERTCYAKRTHRLLMLETLNLRRLKKVPHLDGPLEGCCPWGRASSRDPRTRSTAAAKASGAAGFPRKRLRRPLSWNGVDFTPTMGGTQSPPPLFNNSGDIRD